jgi:Cd2+/Zn2+-exporting ATPase
MNLPNPASQVSSSDDSVHFVYDAEINRFDPSLDEPLETCMMRLEKAGGRACESCALNIENRVRKFHGVTDVSASFTGGILKVRFNPLETNRTRVITDIRAFGVGLEPFSLTPTAPREPPFRRGPIESVRDWLESERAEIIFTIITFVTMIGGLLTELLGGPGILRNLFFVTAYATGGYFGLQAGLESLRHRTIDVDLLMILAAIGAALVDAPFEGAMLLFLFSLSNVLQNIALEKTRSAIRALMALRPQEATIRKDKETVRLPVEAVLLNEEMIVKPGERIPLDGVVIEGASAVDQSPITGESIPVSKQVGETVLAGTINQNGSLVIRVSRLAQDSTISRLIRMVAEAQSEKARTQRFIDRAEQVYAYAVILMTIAAIAVPLVFLGENLDTAFYRAMTLMVAASPCALVISTPATVLSAIGNGARRGILFKGGAHLEKAAEIKVVAFDKTGTLTLGKPRVTDILLLNPTHLASSEESLLAIAAAVESHSEHPLAHAIASEATDRNLPQPEVSGFLSTPGKGVRADVEGSEVLIGSLRFFKDRGLDHGEEAGQAVDRLQDAGKTPILVSVAGVLAGVIAVADVLRPDVQKIIAEMRAVGIEQVVMLTGDHKRVADQIGREAGLDHVYAEMLPEDKLNLIKVLEREHGPVAMVGDGVNDAPALVAASIGIAMGAAGTDVAMETADIVLMGDDLSNLPYLIDLSRQTRRTLFQNLAFSLAVILVLIGAVLGFQLALPLSVIGHEGSTVLVSLNGLRMLRFNRK